LWERTFLLMGARGAGRSGPRPGRGRLDAVWRHAPTVLLRYPTLFAAIAFGTLLLTAATVAYPLFMSATTSGLVRGAIDRPSVTRYGAGMAFRYANLPLETTRLQPGLRSPDIADLDEPFRRLTAESPILGEPIVAALGETVTVSAPGGTETRDGRLFASTGVLDHVAVLSGQEGDGVWLPDLIADGLGLGPGDTIELLDLGGGTATVPVDGVYRAVYRTQLGGYWFSWQEEFHVPCPDCSPLPQPILADRDQVIELARALGQDSVTATWVAPIEDPAAVGLEDALELQRLVGSVRERISDLDTPLGRLFAGSREFFSFGRVSTNLSSSIGLVVADAQEQVAAVEGPTRVLQLAAIAVAVVVVAAAGAFSIRARRVEAAWLFARGTSAWSVGLKAALESALPCLIGGLLGFAAAFLAVALVGPVGRIERSATLNATLFAVLAVVVAIVVISAVSARTFVSVVEPHGHRFARIAALVPWELGLAVLAYLALQRLREGGAFIPDERLGVLKPSLALVAFPFLLLAAFAIFSARVARFGVARLRRPTAGASPAPYLATRRLAGSGALAVMLVGAAGLCLGTFLHAQIVSSSLETTVAAKAGVFVGADVAGKIDYRTPVPETFPYPMTRAVRFGAGARLPSDRPLDLLAVDAATLPDAAYWHPRFADAPLEDLMGLLVEPSGDRVPVLLAGGGRITFDEIEVAGATTPVEIVARTTAFPGMYSLNPMVVVDEATFLGLVDLPFNPLNDAGASTELWVEGDPDGVRAAFGEVPFPPHTIVAAEEIAEIPYIAAAINTFVVVNVLGLIAASLTLVGMLLYLQARQRAQVVSQAISTRMGMRHAQHLRALALELGAMLAWSFAVGAALALAAASFTVPLLDPITTIPPPPLLILPLVLIAVAGIAVAGFSWFGAFVMDRRARTVDLGAVMRVAE
jgi:putative ABC transport system permease protein